jgi:4-hydroxybenzoate polyprenyltransferase
MDNARKTSPLQTIRIWADMVKFAHSVFALPFALIATFMAGRHLPEGHPHWLQLVLIILCMVGARSFAMTFNRIADAMLDARNPRTMNRPLPAGSITRASAWVFLITAAVAFMLACALFFSFYGNPWPILLSVPTLIFLAAYSYTKRFTTFAHFVLGAGIAFAPTAAWIAVDPASLGWPAILLSGTVLFWIAGFDIIYACQDIDVDRREGLYSVPARLGIRRALLISRLCHVVTVLLLIAMGLRVGMGALYWSGVGLTGLLLAAEQSVVRPNDLSRVNMAFFNINGCISILMGAAAISDLLLRPR